MVNSNFKGIDNSINVWECGSIGVVRRNFVFDFCNDFVVDKLDDIGLELRIGCIRVIEEFIELKVKAEEGGPKDVKVIDSRVFGEGYGNNVELGEVDFVCAGAGGGNHD